VTCHVTFCGRWQEVTHDVPQRVFGLHALSERKRARAIGRSGSEAVTHRRQTALNLRTANSRTEPDTHTHTHTHRLVLVASEIFPRCHQTNAMIPSLYFTQRAWCECVSHTTDKPQGHVCPTVADTTIRPLLFFRVYTLTSKLSPPIAIISALCLVTLCATVFANLRQPRCRLHNNKTNEMD